MSKTQEKNYQIEERTRITVPHLDRELAVAHPFYGPANAKTLRKEIRADDLREPSTGEVISFAHVAYKGEEKQFQEATEIMDKRHFRAFTGFLYDPETKKAYSTKDIDFNEDSIVTLNREDTIRRADAGDPSIRTLDFQHIRRGERTPRELAVDPYMIFWAEGEQGAEKAGEIADRTRARKGYLLVPDVELLTEPTVRIAALDVYYDGRLYVGGSYYGLIACGYAFGVFGKAGETYHEKSKQ